MGPRDIRGRTDLSDRSCKDNADEYVMGESICRDTYSTAVITRTKSLNVSILIPSSTSGCSLLVLSEGVLSSCGRENICAKNLNCAKLTRGTFASCLSI
jgi:hypothetical protein